MGALCNLPRSIPSRARRFQSRGSFHLHQMTSCSHTISTHILGDQRWESTDLLQHPWLAAHASNAFKQTSVIRCEVRTFPAQTAESGEGDNRVFSGMMTAGLEQRELAISRR
jgi:hypothetical protein